MNVSIPPYIAVDAAFLSTRFTQRPWDRNNLDEAKAIYNKLQSGAKMVIEQTWEMIVNKFMCLTSPLRLKGNHDSNWRDKARKIILTCVILHNMCIEHKPPTDAEIMLARERAQAARRNEPRPDLGVYGGAMNEHDIDHDMIRDALTAWGKKFFRLNNDNVIRFSESCI